VDEIERIVADEQIDCEFQRLDGYLFLDPTDKRESLDKELEALHHAGFNDAAILDRAPVKSFNTGSCIRFPRQGQFHPMKYLNALAKAITKSGGKIFTGTHVEKFEKNAIGTRAGKTVRAASIVVATNSPINDRVAIHTKQAAYRTYVIGATVPKGSIETLLLWDTGDQTKSNVPYHYIRTERFNESSDLLIVGGEDHKTGQDENQDSRYAALETWTFKHFPEAKQIAYRWSGQVMEPIDGLAYIGRNPMDDENVYICTGDSGNGMTHGTIAGLLISDLILGKKNPWTELYDPSRKTLRALTDFARENINVAAQYTDWAKEGEISSFEELQPGEGGVIKDGPKAYALYRDPDGNLSATSAVCTHLGCIVHWNSSEKTFDCPCHGSRFTGRGEVVNGPAARNLEPKKLEEVAELTKISKQK
jgi:glycine/D-amino acid oxidase-like deaminating enzyme/nitrite reductase/ring-hydroxylating ferredoxin subunit